MIGFHKTLSLDEVEAIHSYLDKQQESLPDKVEMSFFEKIEYWFVYWLAKLGEKYPDLLEYDSQVNDVVKSSMGEFLCQNK